VSRAGLAALVLLAACGDALKRPTSNQARLSGTVYLGGFDQRGDPLPGATVQARAVGGDVLATTTSADGGSYALQFDAAPSTRLVLSVVSPHLAPQYRTLTVGPKADVSLSLALEPLEDFECSDGRCLNPSDELTLDNVSEDLAGASRTFDAPTELFGFSGLETLRPLAVGYFELFPAPPRDAGTLDDGGVIPEDDAGLDDAGTIDPTFDAGPPRLSLRVPFPEWRRLEDAVAGNGQVDVPLLTFDSARASWDKRLTGHLETESGLTIAEAALPKVRAGDFSGGVVAVADAPVTGFWALALPAQSPGCIQGTVDAAGKPGEGATLSFENAEAVTVGSDGTFCASAPIGAGGASSTPALSYAGATYQLPMVTLPTAAGSCGGACAQAGTLKLSSELVTQLSTCELTGRALDAAGNPLAQAVVQAFDESVPGASFNNLCGKLGTRCALSSTTDDQGAFSLKVPLFRGLTVSALAVTERDGVVESSRSGSVRLPRCPTGPLDVPLPRGRDKVEVAVKLEGNTIRWLPNRPAQAVRVFDVDGVVKWEVVSGLGLPSPFSYGLLPSGAQQTVPESGSPPALATGDQVSLVLDGTGADGYQFSGSGQAVVP